MYSSRFPIQLANLMWFWHDRNKVEIEFWLNNNNPSTVNWKEICHSSALKLLRRSSTSISGIFYKLQIKLTFQKLDHKNQSSRHSTLYRIDHKFHNKLKNLSSLQNPPLFVSTQWKQNSVSIVSRFALKFDSLHKTIKQCRLKVYIWIGGNNYVLKI